MMPWFIWKGKNSLADFGLWINKLPKRVKAEERHEEIQIPGRAGSVILLEGEDVYDPYSDEMVVIARNDINIDKVVEWLRGRSELVLSNEIDKCRIVSILGEVAFERVGNSLVQATIPLYCQPFRKARYTGQDTVQITGSTGSIFNSGDVASKPIITITGSGNNAITIAGNTMSFTGIDGTIKVDCDSNIVSQSGAIWTGSYSGDFWKIPKGTVAIAQTGSMTITIDPQWRWF